MSGDPYYFEDEGDTYGSAISSGVQAASSSSSSSSAPFTRLFVAHAVRASIEDLTRWFGKYGPLAKPPEKYGAFAFVEFHSMEMCAAVVALNGVPIRESPLRWGDAISLGATVAQFYLAAPNQRGLLGWERALWITLGLCLIAQVFLVVWLQR
jgi:hypothetical protein